MDLSISIKKNKFNLDDWTSPGNKPVLLMNLFLYMFAKSVEQMAYSCMLHLYIFNKFKS